VLVVAEAQNLSQKNADYVQKLRDIASPQARIWRLQLARGRISVPKAQEIGQTRVAQATSRSRVRGPRTRVEGLSPQSTQVPRHVYSASDCGIGHFLQTLCGRELVEVAKHALRKKPAA